MDLHVEAAGALRQRLADLAEAVDAELLAVEALADELQRLPAGPGARADHVLAFGGAPRRAEQQQHGDLGGRHGDAVRRVADLDAARLAGFEIDVVEADRERRDALDVARASCSITSLRHFSLSVSSMASTDFAVSSISSMVIFGSSPCAMTS